MQVTDLNGNAIRITDLPKAIAQAKAFLGYSHTGQSYRELDRQLKEYWTDLYQKLVAIQNRLDNNKKQKQCKNQQYLRNI